MSTILAIETSSEIASVALLYRGTVTVRHALGSQTHSHSVLPMIAALFDESGLKLAVCDAIAFGAGPGSFTGVRTACGVAQGLAFGLDRPVLAINTLEALALACHQATGAAAVLPLLDARMGEVYWAQYAFETGLTEVIAPRLSAPANVLPTAAVLACGNALSAYAADFAGSRFHASGRADLMPHAAQIATLGQAAFDAGLQVAAREAQPIYLRNNVALTTAERLEKIRKVTA